MMIGLVQPGTSRGTFLQMMGSRNTTPPRMFRMVPFGDFHICLRPKYISSISRNGLISLSLMYCQMIRVISSPSSSTTGLVTLIFAMTDRAFLETARFGWGWGSAVAIAPENAGWKANGRAAGARFQAALRRRASAARALPIGIARSCRLGRRQPPAGSPSRANSITQSKMSEHRLRGRARHHIPGDDQSADQRAGQAGAGPPPGE